MDDAQRTRCAVVIPTYNGAHVLRPCLEAVLRDPPQHCRQEIIVVDDASTDGTRMLLAEFASDVRVVVQPTNRGFGMACNAGAAAAGDVDHLVFLNNDTVALGGWLDALVAAAREDPAAAAVGARLLYPNGTIQHAGVTVCSDGWPRHLYVGFPAEHPAVMRPRRVAAATAACLLVRRPLFDLIGGFDDAFLNGYEDLDLCLRLRELGHAVRYAPSSVLYHLESVTRWPTGKAEPTDENDREYRRRWRHVKPDDLEHYAADGLLRLEYGPHPPLRVHVAPLLGTAAPDGADDTAMARLLRDRTAQALELQSAATREALRASRGREAVRLAAQAPVDTTARLVREGRSRRAAGSRLVSLLLPVKNGAADLREQLPLILEQEVDADIELVAVDSGSQDDSLDVLAEFDATVLAIDSSAFDHGLTRNLAAAHAGGDVLLFVTHRMRPVGRRWLAPLLAALDSDPTVAGACSRVVPGAAADPLARRDAALDPSGSSARRVAQIEDWTRYREGAVEDRRRLLNFHTVSTVIRASVLQAIPFRSVRTIGEDLLWAQETLEAGFALAHEPASVAEHWHDYSLPERFARNVDDGVANRDIVGRRLDAADVDPMIRQLVAADWEHLEGDPSLTAPELMHWRVESVMRRCAQVTGQWLGTNHDAVDASVIDAFSRVSAMRRGSA